MTTGAGFRPLIPHWFHAEIMRRHEEDRYEFTCECQKPVELRPVDVPPIRSCGWRPNLVPELPAGQVRWTA